MVDCIVLGFFMWEMREGPWLESDRSVILDWGVKLRWNMDALGVFWEE